MRQLSRFLFIAILGISTTALAKDEPKPAPAKAAPAKTAKTAKTAKPAKKAPPKPIPVVSGDKKKKAQEYFAGFKFGMTKDEVLAQLSKQLDERYNEKIKATTDMTTQDRLRKEKKAELARITATYTAFEGKKTGWDVSIVENEFAHNTGESMLERWENTGGKNNRRFFFFHDGKLWKMFISLDVSILPEDKKNFETLQGYMKAQFGQGLVELDRISWNAGEFHVRALDKLKSYDAIALVLEDPREAKELVALRESKAAPKPDTSPVIKAVIEDDKAAKPDVKHSDSAAVDAVIKAQGADAPKKK